MGIKFSKLVTNIDIYIYIILFPGINKYNLKQTHPKFTVSTSFTS